MRKMFSVLHYEYKMQFKRLVTWGVLLVATALSLLDNFHNWFYTMFIIFLGNRR